MIGTFSESIDESKGMLGSGLISAAPAQKHTDKARHFSSLAFPIQALVSSQQLNSCWREGRKEKKFRWLTLDPSSGGHSFATSIRNIVVLIAPTPARESQSCKSHQFLLLEISRRVVEGSVPPRLDYNGNHCPSTPYATFTYFFYLYLRCSPTTWSGLFPCKTI